MKLSSKRFFRDDVSTLQRDDPAEDVVLEDRRYYWLGAVTAWCSRSGRKRGTSTQTIETSELAARAPTRGARTAANPTSFWHFF